MAKVIAVFAIPFVALVWLGWRLIDQDRALDRQRVQDRLTLAADLAAASLSEWLASLDERLGKVAEAPPQARDAMAATLVGADDEAMLVAVTQDQLWTSAPLPFYPAAPDYSDYPDPAASAFAAAERVELAGDLERALAIYRADAQHADITRRAGALARLARVASKLNRPDLALDSYDALARLGPRVAALGRPADLVGTLQRSAVLADAGRRDELHTAARAIDHRLRAGEWRLSRGQYGFYRSRVAEWLAGAPELDRAEPIADGREALAHLVLAAAGTLPSRPAGPADRGRDSLAGPLEPGLMIWRRTAQGATALVATRASILRTWAPAVDAIEQRQRAQVSLSIGSIRWRGAGRTDDSVRREASETGLPFTVGAIALDPAGDRAAFIERRWLLAGVLAALSLLVVAGGYVAARGLGRELAAARLRSDFVAAVSHEFRTPVASVRQLSELLEDGRVSDPARRAEYYGLLRRESVRLQRLVENLLDFRRLEAGAVEYRFDRVDAGQLIREIVGEFTEERRAGHRIHLRMPASLPPVRADSEAIARARWNLLDNASKYSPADTAITVEADSAAGAVEIRVRDEGSGIPVDDQARIFEKFVRGSDVRTGGPKGAGIGLALVKHIVDAHHGRVGVASRPGAGSTFTIHLPAEQPS